MKYTMTFITSDDSDDLMVLTQVAPKYRAVCMVELGSAIEGQDMKDYIDAWNDMYAEV